MPKAVIVPQPAPSPAPVFAQAAVGLRPVALTFRVLTIAAITTGIVRNAGLLSDAPDLTTFLYYTMVSNLLGLAWMLLLVVRTGVELHRFGARGTSTPSARGSGAVMMAVTVTMLIYLVVLVPTRVDAGDGDIFSLTDTLIHIVTPLLLIVDWLAFVPKGSFRWVDPLLWTVIPLAYLAWAFIHGALGGEFVPGQRYPYPFMDVDVLGVGGVAVWIIALTVALTAVGYVFVVVDRALGAFSRRRA